MIVCSLENFQWKLSNPCLFHVGCRVKKSILKLKVQILIKQLCSFVIKATICTSTHSAVCFCVVIVLPFHVFWSFLSKYVFVFSEMYLCLHKSICICPDLHQHWTASFPNKGVARACPLLIYHYTETFDFYPAFLYTTPYFMIQSNIVFMSKNVHKLHNYRVIRSLHEGEFGISGLHTIKQACAKNILRKHQMFTKCIISMSEHVQKRYSFETSDVYKEYNQQVSASSTWYNQTLSSCPPQPSCLWRTCHLPIEAKILTRDQKYF